jgi:hypothetical protein
MSETLEPVTTELDQKRLAEQLLAQANEQGVELVGPDGRHVLEMESEPDDLHVSGPPCRVSPSNGPA